MVDLSRNTCSIMRAQSYFFTNDNFISIPRRREGDLMFDLRAKEKEEIIRENSIILRRKASVGRSLVIHDILMAV